MSLARVYTTKGPVRKDGLKCGKCGRPIVKGQDRRITFAVGFRGREQTRCTDPGCHPALSERESSAVSAIYAAQESVDVSAIEAYDDFISARDDIVSTCEEVADEYENNEMYDVNSDLQERAEQVRSAGEELADWEPQDEAPDENDPETWAGVSYVDALDNWLEQTRDSLESAINDMDLP